MVSLHLDRFNLYWNTIKWMKPVQWKYRVKNSIFTFFHASFPRFSKRFYEVNCPENYDFGLLPKGPVEWFRKDYSSVHGMFSVSDVIEGKFTFLNRSKYFATDITWQNKEFSYLWDFNLHYFEYLLPIAMIEGKVAEAKVSAFLKNWVRANPCPKSPAWHPYTTSLRIVNWIKLLLNYPQYGTQEITRSLYTQLVFLEKNLEGHLLVNHLWENGRALIFGGLFFSGSVTDRWYAKGINLLKNELVEQILPAGGHFERSPMYHSILLEGLLDTSLILEWAKKGENWVEKTIIKMCKWLETIQTPDGNFPLFNDAAIGISAKPEEIFNNAHRIVKFKKNSKKNSIMNVDGLVVMDAGHFNCFVDGASIGPDYNPGHAHADNFTYELFFQKESLIVDTGTPTYDINSLRQYSKSTSEHNTVSVNSLEQSELWGGFRVARRSNPESVWVGTQNEYLLFKGKYTNKVNSELGICHERHIITKNDEWILIWDNIRARKNLKLESYCKLHPRWEVIKKDNHFDLISDEGKSLFLYPIRVEESSIVPSFYYPEFGSSYPTSKLRFSKNGDCHLEFGYIISQKKISPIELTISLTDNSISIKLNGNCIDLNHGSLNN